MKNILSIAIISLLLVSCERDIGVGVHGADAFEDSKTQTSIDVNKTKTQGQSVDFSPYKTIMIAKNINIAAKSLILDVVTKETLNNGVALEEIAYSENISCIVLGFKFVSSDTSNESGLISSDYEISNSDRICLEINAFDSPALSGNTGFILVNKDSPSSP